MEGMNEIVTNLVQVPAARGKVMPDTDSISDDFPELCWPTTTIWGRSISTETLFEDSEVSSRMRRKEEPLQWER